MRWIGIVCLLSVAQSDPCMACIWNAETMAREQRGLPGVYQTIMGRFEKHSDLYHQKIIERFTLEELETRDDIPLEEYDDIAVAHERLGDHESAIRVMKAKGKLLEKKPDPEHRYRFHANLGTFYAHKGELEKAETEIERAIEINPDAHFGREKYQLQAIRYLLADPPQPATVSFVEYRENLDEPRKIQRKEIEEIIHALNGMIVMGQQDSPLLYYTLGKMLMWNNHYHLGWRALERAKRLGYTTENALDLGFTGNGIEGLQRAAVEQVEVLNYPDPSTTFDEELAEAKAWVEKFQEFEGSLIRGGIDHPSPSDYRSFYRENGHESDQYLRDGRSFGDRMAAFFHGDDFQMSIFVIVCGVICLVVIAHMRQHNREWRAFREKRNQKEEVRGLR